MPNKSIKATGDSPCLLRKLLAPRLISVVRRNLTIVAVYDKIT